MDMAKVDSTRALVNHWRIFRIIGVHPPGKRTVWGRHYTAYSMMWNVTFHFCIWLSFSVNLLQSNSLETFCESLCVAMPHTLFMLKLINVGRMRGEMIRSHRVLRHLDRRLGCADERRIIVAGIEQAEFIFRTILRGIVCTVTVGIVYMAVASEPTLMYPSWIPWNWRDSSSSYLSTAMLHTTAIMANATAVLNLCTYPGTYLILVSAHTKALALRVSKLGYGTPLPAVRMQAILVGYIHDHQIILRLFKSLERSLSMTCFLQFVCTACAQCTICYFLLFVNVGIMRFMNMLFLLVALTTETLLLCYTAELLCKEGESLLTAVYSCNWLSQSVHFRRLLLLMLARCQNPLILVAGVIVPISMKTFMVVIKGAYTMLTLLNEIRKSSLE
ncbi:putative odorant receptor 19b isoform X2 [Drosophila sechellia]|uniref:Odorant receptor n=1 Tax=Drosophila sechellia TaxID=7238 RepID=B4I7E7_DROSE|nr:putative odorant receptor 19b isoform X2 [Drosophila sechellia]EDW56245.1 GM22693 [Drosophila sechellia]